MSLLSNIESVVQRLRGSGSRCGHIDQIRDVTPASDGCEQCVAVGDTWVRLKTCTTCGQVGCCDFFDNRHASSACHPVALSREPGEDWTWCYVDGTFLENAR